MQRILGIVGWGLEPNYVDFNRLLQVLGTTNRRMAPFFGFFTSRALF